MTLTGRYILLYLPDSLSQYFKLKQRDSRWSWGLSTLFVIGLSQSLLYTISWASPLLVTTFAFKNHPEVCNMLAHIPQGNLDFVVTGRSSSSWPKQNLMLYLLCFDLILGLNRKAEHFWREMFGVTLGFSFATETPIFCVICDLMNSTTKNQKKIISARCPRRQPKWRISWTAGERVQRPHVSQLWQAKQRKIFRNFSSHENSQQRLVRDHRLLLRKTTTQ